jgi:aspartate/methionine/tyrosine aminotransferase
VFTPTRYLAWAMKFYGQVPFDLATSGAPIVSWKELGLPHPDIDDINAFESLKEAIAKYNDVSAAEVTPSMGTSNAIFLAYAALVSPGDDVLVETPGYEPLYRSAEGLGATIRTFPRRLENGFAINPDEVAALIGPRTRAIVLTTLHNPTGTRTPDATIIELAKIAEARGAYVLVDEVYAPFDALPEDGVFRTSARKLAPNVITVGSLTKCYGLGWHRIGWVLGSEEITARATTASVGTVGHLPLHHAAYGVAGFSVVGQLAKRTKATLENKREIAAAWVKSLGPSAHWSNPKEGLFGLVTLPGRGDLLEKIEANARATGCLVGAGTFFGAPESFRLSWATSNREKFEAGLRHLEALAR